MFDLKDTWAKSKPPESIEYHCSEVAAKIKQLSELPLPILRENIETLLKAGLLHDIGKAHKAFQGKIKANLNKGVPVYHGNISKQYILEAEPSSGFLAELVSGHHGIWRSDNNQYEAGSALLNCNMYNTDHNQVLNYILNIINQDDSNHPAYLQPILEKYLILADRIASSGSTLLDDLQAIKQDWSLKIRRSRMTINGKKKFLNDLQIACIKLRDGKWYEQYDRVVIEASTGIGKTLAAISLIPPNARIVYLSPTRMLTDEISKKLKEYGLDDIRSVHGDAKESNYGHDEEGDTITKARMSELINFGATSLYPQVCATIDQYVFFGKPCKFNVMGALENTYIIIDELHSYDHQILSYLVSACKWWIKYGCKIIFLSATLPDIIKSQLLPQYTKPKHNHYPTIILNNDINADFVDCNSLLPWFRKIFNKIWLPSLLKDKELVFIEEDKVEDMIIKEFEKNNKIAYIINNVKTAQEIYKKIRKNSALKHVEILLLHSKFIKADRRKNEAKLKKLMGNKNNKVLVVSTQVIEHGHDLDFDVMFTRWAPIDRIIQRVGRLHRRRTDKSEARLYMIKSTGGAADSERYVYPEFLDESWELLKKAGKITCGNISKLINEVYKDPIILELDIPGPDEISEMHSFTSDDGRSVRDNKSIEVVLHRDANNLVDPQQSKRDNMIRMPVWICKDEKYGTLGESLKGWCFYMGGNNIEYSSEIGLQTHSGNLDAE